MAIDHQPPAGPPMPWGSQPYPHQQSYGHPQPYGYSSQPYGYAPQPYGYQAQPAYVVPTSGLAVASLVCSLVGLLTFGLVAIAGVICGHMALGETRSGQRGGHGMAVAGLIIGWIQCGGWILFWLFVLIGAVGSL